MNNIKFKNEEVCVELINKYREKIDLLYHELSKEIFHDDRISGGDNHMIMQNISSFIQTAVFKYLDKNCEYKMSTIIKINLMMILINLEDEKFLKKMKEEFGLDNLDFAFFERK